MKTRSRDEDYVADMFPGLVNESPQIVNGTVKNVEKIAKKVDRSNGDDWISDMAGVFTDPIVTTPGGVGDRLPDKMKDDITIQRLLQLMLKHRRDPEGELATWPETCWYLSGVSMEQPLDHDWVQIYMYAFTKYYGENTPADLRVEKLDKSQEHDLLRFRKWLYNSRIRARVEKARVERKEKREQEKEAQRRREKETRPGLF